ncbi:Fc.00g088140.m01.CDS01 [Cosmosporella sp. VM-42]
MLLDTSAWLDAVPKASQFTFGICVVGSVLICIRRSSLFLNLPLYRLPAILLCLLGDREVWKQQLLVLESDDLQRAAVLWGTGQNSNCRVGAASLLSLFSQPLMLAELYSLHWTARTLLTISFVITSVLTVFAAKQYRFFERQKPADIKAWAQGPPKEMIQLGDLSAKGAF